MALMGLLFNYLFMQKYLANQSTNFIDIFPFSKWFSSMIINFQRKNAPAALRSELPSFVHKLQAVVNSNYSKLSNKPEGTKKRVKMVNFFLYVLIYN